MQLYDGKSAIDWADRGRVTAAKMKKDPYYADVFAGDVVLIELPNGKAIATRPLGDVAADYGIEPHETAAETWAAIEYAIEHPQVVPTDSERIDALEADSLDKDEAITELYEMILGGE